MKSGLGEFGFGISGDLNQAYPAKMPGDRRGFTPDGL